MSNNTVYLPQFAGESNPFDVLWYLSVEIGRALLFKAKRIGSGIYEGVDELQKKYNETFEKVSNLTEEEREFLLRDSYFTRCDFYNDENKKLLEIESESSSDMSYCSQLVSEDFLKATLGDEAGTLEYQRRCKLVSVGKRYTKQFLHSVIDYLEALESDEQGGYSDGIQEFMKQFENTPSVEDVQLMIDVNSVKTVSFYDVDNCGGNINEFYKKANIPV